MALTRNPLQTTRDLHLDGVSLWESYCSYAEQRGRPLSIRDAAFAIVELFNSQLKIVAENDGQSNDLGDRLKNNAAIWYENNRDIQREFRSDLARKLNSGKWIAIGYRVYSEKRRELNYVWDARFRGADFDFTDSAYSGAQYQYEEIRIIEREKCNAELLKKFDRKRAGKIGRPVNDDILLAISQAADRTHNYWDAKRHKAAVWEAQGRFSEITGLALTDELAKIPINKAIRKRRKLLA